MDGKKRSMYGTSVSHEDAVLVSTLTLVSGKYLDSFVLIEHSFEKLDLLTIQSYNAHLILGNSAAQQSRSRLPRQRKND